MPGTIKKKGAIVYQVLQHVSRTRKIGQRKQAKACRNQFPTGEQEQDGGQKGKGGPHPLPKGGPERLKARGAEGEEEQTAEKPGIELRFLWGFFFRR